MNVVYAFIGPLPDYAVDTVYQLRLFYDGPVYFIVSDLESPYCSTLKEKYNVEIVPYESVKDNDFISLSILRKDRLHIVDTLKGREKLFIYAFERFFLLKNLMHQRNIQNVLFLELDNLIYDNPEKWLSSFSEKDMAFMFDNIGRYSSGISFIKTYNVLNLFYKVCENYILHSSDFLNEMSALGIFRNEYSNSVQILPTHWPVENNPKDTYDNYEKYNNTLFDAAAMGIYIGGMDPFHTQGIITYGLRSRGTLLDYTGYKYEWKLDEKNRKIPHIWDGGKWLRINNLHIHSKDLKHCFSV
jgi:hypothetical protein